MAREVTIPVDDMGVGRARLISGQREAGDEGADAHFPARINIGYLAHYEIPNRQACQVRLRDGMRASAQHGTRT